jgi:putative transposase
MNLDLMQLIDKQFSEMPFYGVRQMTWHLRHEGHVVNQKPDTSGPAKGHKSYPCLLTGLRVERPNQV